MIDANRFARVTRIFSFVWIAALAAGFSARAGAASVFSAIDAPAAKAELIEKQAGREMGIGLKKALTEYRRAGTDAVTRFRFLEERKVYCVVAPCPPLATTSDFFVVKREKVGCDSVKYTVREENLTRGRTMEIVDHSRRSCDDYRPFVWEVTLFDGAGARRFYGSPAPVAD